MDVHPCPQKILVAANMIMMALFGGLIFLTKDRQCLFIYTIF